MTNLVSPDSFGKVGHVFTTLTLVIILFESGLGLDFSTLRDAMSNAVRLTSISFAASMAAVAITSCWVLKLSVLDGLLLGAILAGTSPATCIPLLNKLDLKEPFRTTMLLEPTLSDVLCIVVSLALLEIARSDQIKPGLIIGGVMSSFLLAALLGIVFAFVWSSILAKVRRFENSAFTTPAFASIIYGLTEFLGFSGPIAVFAFGIVLGNIRVFTATFKKYLPSAEPISMNRAEKELLANMVFLLKTLFFVYLGLSVTCTNQDLLMVGVVLTVWIFLVRIPAVLFSIDKRVGRYEVSIASVMVAKGLAAAALAARPMQVGLSSGYVIKEVVYDVVLASIVLTAVLTFLIDRGKLSRVYNFLFSKYPLDTTVQQSDS
jgi:NhaP-type Na+/H+ or K+/H+ antiporter